MISVDTPEDLLGLAGRDLGTTEPTEIRDEHLRDFEGSTGAEGTEYLALSLVNLFLPRLLEVATFSMGVNVGLDSVRFGPAVVAGDRLVGSGRILGVDRVGDGIQVVVEVTVAAEDAAEPACVAETVSRFFA